MQQNYVAHKDSIIDFNVTVKPKTLESDTISHLCLQKTYNFGGEIIIPGLLIEQVLIGGDQFLRPYTFHRLCTFVIRYPDRRKV